MDSQDSTFCQKRIQAKGWFLTYPRCDLAKDFVLSAAETHGRISEYVIATETHLDGTPHLHAFIKYEKKVYWKSNKWDVAGYHGNYQVAKCWKAVERYCKKGGDFIANIDLDSAKAKKGKQNKFLIESDPIDLVDSGEIHITQLNNLLKNKETYLQLKRERDPIPEDSYPKTKKRHFWVYGPSNGGKTSLMDALMEAHPNDCYMLPPDCKWENYKGQHYIIVDEFKGSIPIQEINRICDGGHEVPCRHVKRTLVKRTQVYVFSNYAPEDCYCKADRVATDALKNRFNVFPFNFRSLPGYDEDIHNEDNKCPFDLDKIFIIKK